jgi:hypothetical protein
MKSNIISSKVFEYIFCKFLKLFINLKKFSFLLKNFEKWRCLVVVPWSLIVMPSSFRIKRVENNANRDKTIQSLDQIIFLQGNVIGKITCITYLVLLE